MVEDWKFPLLVFCSLESQNNQSLPKNTRNIEKKTTLTAKQNLTCKRKNIYDFELCYKMQLKRDFRNFGIVGVISLLSKLIWKKIEEIGLWISTEMIRPSMLSCEKRLSDFSPCFSSDENIMNFCRQQEYGFWKTAILKLHYLCHISKLHD